jgi:hypothetical protein
MNFLLGTLGANITLGLISKVTGTINGVFTLSSNILKSNAIGSEEVKQLIKEIDLEVKIKTTQLLLSELKIDDQSPNTVRFCLQSIKDAIKDIADELDTVYFRIQYNNNLLFGSRIRSYKFHNCRERLISKLKILDSRNKTLITVISIQSSMYKNLTLNVEPE